MRVMEKLKRSLEYIKMETERQECVSSSSGSGHQATTLPLKDPHSEDIKTTKQETQVCEQADQDLPSSSTGSGSPAQGSRSELTSSSDQVSDLDPQPCSSTTQSSPNSDGTGSRGHVLPPCKVCGGRATGFHYGANTCEACKGFFRRSIIRTEEYVCLKNVKCNIRPGKRNLCAQCRYQRCLAAGMSKDSIKTGRYTYAKRTKDLLEVRQLQQEKNAVKEKEKQEEKEKEMMELVNQVEIAHQTHAPRNDPTLMAAGDMQAKYMETRSKKEILASTMGDIMSREELTTMCQITGLDPLPEDRQSVWEGWLVSIERGLKGIVSFSKDLPGFKDLSIHDQIALLKHSVCEIWLISRHKAFNAESGLFTTLTGLTFEVAKAVGDDIAAEVFNMAIRLQKLELTFQETHMLKAFVIFFPDRCELTDRSAVESLQQQYQDTLEFLLSKNHSDPHIFTKLVLVLRDLRNITELYFTHIEKVLSDMKVPPLFMEILSAS